jgi:hypothetical protein
MLIKTIDSWIIINNKNDIISPRDIIINSFYVKGEIENKKQYTSDKILYIDDKLYLHTKNENELISLKNPSKLYKRIYGIYVKSDFIYVMKSISFFENFDV